MWPINTINWINTGNWIEDGLPKNRNKVPKNLNRIIG